MAPRRRRLLVRFLIVLVIVVAVAAISFLIGYFIGRHFAVCTLPLL